MVPDIGDGLAREARASSPEDVRLAACAGRVGGAAPELTARLPNVVRVPSTRTVLFSLLAGLVHAAVLVAIGVELGYTIGPTEYAPVGVLWRYGGLVVVAAVPVWLALRYRLVAPLLALLATTGFVLVAELTPPGPTFVDVAELERLDEPTGVLVVENGLYVVRYMVNATVWTVGFLLLGLVEYAVRNAWTRLPPVRGPAEWLPIPAPRRRAGVVAAAGGALHAVVMTWFAVRLGVSFPGRTDWALFLFAASGMWILAAVPLYLLVRRQLVAPATVLTVFVLTDVRSEFTASVDDPHALYFGGWFLFLGVLLVVAGVEYGLRRVGSAWRAQRI